MNTAERTNWLAERRKGIGSSDAAKIVGVSEFGTALDCWLDKTGKVKDREPTPEQKWGLLHEPTIAAVYEEQTNQILHNMGNQVQRHPSIPWMLATPDRIGRDRLVELKTANQFTAKKWGEAGTDDIPEGYLLQVQHQMAVTGHQLADLAVLIGLSDFRVYTIKRHDGLIAKLIEREAEFWARVQAGQPPEPDWEHHVTKDVLKLLYGLKPSKEVNLGEDILEIARQKEEARQARLASEKDEERAECLLLHAMQDAAIGHLPDGSRIERKTINRKAYTVDASSYVQLRLKFAKETVS